MKSSNPILNYFVTKFHWFHWFVMKTGQQTKIIGIGYILHQKYQFCFCSNVRRLLLVEDSSKSLAFLRATMVWQILWYILCKANPKLLKIQFLETNSNRLIRKKKERSKEPHIKQIIQRRICFSSNHK